MADTSISHDNAIQRQLLLCVIWMATFNVWLLWNSIHSLLNSILKKGTILKKFPMSTFGYFGRSLPKKANPPYLSALIVE